MPLYDLAFIGAGNMAEAIARGVTRGALYHHIGSKDRLLIPRQGVRAKRIIPRARLVRLPGCGHVPMSDDPALVARVLLDGSR